MRGRHEACADLETAASIRKESPPGPLLARSSLGCAVIWRGVQFLSMQHQLRFQRSCRPKCCGATRDPANSSRSQLQRTRAAHRALPDQTGSAWSRTTAQHRGVLVGGEGSRYGISRLTSGIETILAQVLEQAHRAVRCAWLGSGLCVVARGLCVSFESLLVRRKIKISWNLIDMLGDHTVAHIPDLAWYDRRGNRGSDRAHSLTKGGGLPSARTRGSTSRRGGGGHLFGWTGRQGRGGGQ